MGWWADPRCSCCTDGRAWHAALELRCERFWSCAHELLGKAWSVLRELLIPLSCSRKHWINPPVPEAWSPLKQTVEKQSWNESCDAGKWPLTRTVAVSAGLLWSPLPLPALSDSWSFTFSSRPLPLQPLWRTPPSSTVTPFPVSPVAFHPIFSKRCFCQDFLHTQTHTLRFLFPAWSSDVIAGVIAWIYCENTLESNASQRNEI